MAENEAKLSSSEETRADREVSLAAVSKVMKEQLTATLQVSAICNVSNPLREKHCQFQQQHACVCMCVSD